MLRCFKSILLPIELPIFSPISNQRSSESQPLLWPSQIQPTTNPSSSCCDLKSILLSSRFDALADLVLEPLKSLLCSFLGIFAIGFCSRVNIIAPGRRPNVPMPRAFLLADAHRPAVRIPGNPGTPFLCSVQGLEMLPHPLIRDPLPAPARGWLHRRRSR